jgi:hypothetical protein
MKCYFWALDLDRFFGRCGVFAIRVSGALYMAVKELELEYSHSLPISAKVKNEWSCYFFSAYLLSWHQQEEIYLHVWYA